MMALMAAFAVEVPSPALFRNPRYAYLGYSFFIFCQAENPIGFSCTPASLFNSKKQWQQIRKQLLYLPCSKWKLRVLHSHKHLIIRPIYKIKH